MYKLAKRKKRERNSCGLGWGFGEGHISVYVIVRACLCVSLQKGRREKETLVGLCVRVYGWVKGVHADVDVHRKI